jgi:pilus assembly protein CpaF
MVLYFSVPTDSLPGLKGGARVKILHNIIAPGKGFPSINIRLFEPNPVSPDQLIGWNVAPEPVIRKLLALVGRETRVMVIGGTATGKTTLLSAICNSIPKEQRVVKIEDPEEIWIDHPHVVTIEARPVCSGASVLPYAVKDGVDDAMRMSPRYLIVGEVRRGDAALALFRAMMSDHPGLTTFHAYSPEAAVHRLGVIMLMDAGVPMEATKEIFTQAMDLVVQVGWLDGRRQILGISQVEKRLVGGEVRFRPLYQPGDADMRDPMRQE